MVGLMIANLILSLMSQLADSQTIYECKTKRELDEWRQGLSLQRLLVHKTTVYLMLEKQIISFMAPYTQTDESGEVHLVSSLPFAHEHLEKEDSKKVVGYLVSNEMTYELYRSKVPNRLIGYRLDFENDLGGKHESNYLYLSSKESESAQFLFASLHDRFYTAMFAYRSHRLDFYYYGQPREGFDFQNLPLVNQTVLLSYRVQYAAFYRRAFDEEEDRKKKRDPKKFKNPAEYFLIELDENHHLHVRLITLPNMRREKKEVKFHKDVSIELSHFLSCHQPFESPEQVG